MFRKAEVEEILAQAQRMNPKYEMFGVSATGVVWQMRFYCF